MAAVRYTYFADGLEGWKAGYERANYLLERADALIVTPGFPLAQIAQYQSSLHDRISQGMRVVFAGVPGTEEDRLTENQMLARYYLELLPLKIVQGNEGNRYWVIFDSAQDCLSANDLFAGVHKLQLSSPAVVRYSGEARPLVYGSEEHWTVDRRTDFRDPLLGRRVTPMGIWMGSSRGAVIVDQSAGTLADPIDVPAGRIPGIEANRTFAKNLVEFLIAAPTTQVRTTIRDRLARIECNLCDFVVGVLSLKDPNWLALVPPKIATKLAEKAEDGRTVRRFGEKTSAIAFSEMWNFGEIIRANWLLFQGYFKEFQMSRNDVQKTIEALNELRRLPGHPALEYVTNYKFSADEVRLVEEMDSMLLELARPFLGSATGTPSSSP